MLENLRRKKIAIVGFGVNNQKLGDFFSRQEIKFEKIEHWQDPDELTGKLDDFDLIFRTPGLPFLSKAIQQAKEKGVGVSSQTKLFFQVCQVPIIAVTGTKGKGTTSSLIEKILTSAGRKIRLGGNIGKDPFEFLEKIQPNDLVVLELSSFQLQDLTQSPHIAVVLSITSDHLNHHRSLKEYIEAKSNILKYQTTKDYAVLHKHLPESLKNLGNGRRIFFDPKDVESFETKLLGRHNLENIAAATAVSRLMGVDEETTKSTVATFETLPHHLEIVKIKDQITYLDDAVSTNVDTTIAAIEAVETPIILIVGGHDKGVDFKPLGNKIFQSTKIKALVVIGEVTEKILDAVKGFEGKILIDAKNMNEILKQARSVAAPGDTILMSPGTDSFDMFRNMYDRAEQFVRAVEAL